MSKHSVSVVIPTYNRARFLHEAVDSCLAQDGVDVEVILVDDGSTDDTAAAVQKRYADEPRLRYIVQENGGAPKARNRGIAEARHDWVAFLDSDDVWLPGKLATQLDEFARHPDAVSHLGNVSVSRPGVEETDLVSLRGIGEMFSGDSAVFIKKPLTFNVRHNFGRLQTLVARRDVLNRIGGFDEEMRFFQDSDLMNRLTLEGPWLVSPRLMANEIRREEEGDIGIGAQRAKKMYAGYADLAKQMVGLLETHDATLSDAERQVIREKMSQYALMATTGMIRANQTGMARDILKRTRPGIPSFKRRLLGLLLTVPPLARALVR
ncbi:MAG: glycosyltransferase family A protein [Pseudomonadota bacterium]